MTILQIDPRPVFDSAVATAASVVTAVSASQLAYPTPCTDYDVRRLFGHMVTVLHRVALIGQGGNAFAVPTVTEGIADDKWTETWTDAAAKAAGAWSNDASLSRLVKLPWAEMPGAATLAMYVSEVVVHTWDLATATGQHPTWDDQVIEVAFNIMRKALPAEGRVAQTDVKDAMPAGTPDFAVPFAEAVEVGDDASPVERLVAWTGRRP